MTNKFRLYEESILTVIGNNGSKFDTNEEVREYFTLDNLEKMFPGEVLPNSLDLTLWADLVIEFKDSSASYLWND